MLATLKGVVEEWVVPCQRWWLGCEATRPVQDESCRWRHWQEAGRRWILLSLRRDERWVRWRCVPSSDCTTDWNWTWRRAPAAASLACIATQYMHHRSGLLHDRCAIDATSTISYAPFQVFSGLSHSAVCAQTRGLDCEFATTWNLKTASLSTIPYNIPENT